MPSSNILAISLPQLPNDYQQQLSAELPQANAFSHEADQAHHRADNVRFCFLSDWAEDRAGGSMWHSNCW